MEQCFIVHPMKVIPIFTHCNFFILYTAFLTSKGVGHLCNSLPVIWKQLRGNGWIWTIMDFNYACCFKSVTFKLAYLFFILTYAAIKTNIQSLGMWVGRRKELHYKEYKVKYMISVSPTVINVLSTKIGKCCFLHGNGSIHQSTDRDSRRKR